MGTDVAKYRIWGWKRCTTDGEQKKYLTLLVGYWVKVRKSIR